MCGFAGFLNFNGGFHVDTARTIVRDMGAMLRHRGPDDDGEWIDGQAGIALSHRRLAILDLTQCGHQPMVSSCRRYVIAFNGEIYNHEDVRKTLQKEGGTPAWLGHSDTETILAAISFWGLEKALQRFAGMFAFALWDKQERTLHLVRDRIGEKPLYYGRMGNTFLFASELKAMRRHPSWCGEIDRNSLALFMRHSYVPAPYSIYKGIHKLPPGTILSLTLGCWGDVIPKPYWSAFSTAKSGIAGAFPGEDEEVTSELEKLLLRVTQEQMISDVPLGAFLSGGVDSSLVVALMQKQSQRPIKTFTIGFNEAQYNEAEYAKVVARHLGTDHTELYVTPDEARAIIPTLSSVYDEPFADSSQIPTMLVAKLARRQVTVALSGDGGDELFGGYNRYLWADKIWRSLRRVPKVGRLALARILTLLPPRVWDRVLAYAPKSVQHQIPGQKMHKLADILATDSPELIYLTLISHWKSPTSLVLGSREPSTILSEFSTLAGIRDFVSRIMLLDVVSYLPDDIMVKVDRATMSYGLETRAPFLDHRVAEFAWRLPLAMKIHHGKGKWPLRQVLYRYVPESLIERPKMGFGVPIGAWLRGPLINWAEDLLDAERLRKEGYLNPQPIQQAWQEHLSGRRNWQYRLWNVLIFEEWLASQKH